SDRRHRAALAHQLRDELGEVADADEVDEHREELRHERRSGDPDAVEEGVHPAADLLDRGTHRVGVGEIHLLEARHPDRRWPPIPFAPSGPYGAGTSTMIVSMSGTASIFGIA